MSVLLGNGKRKETTISQDENAAARAANPRGPHTPHGPKGLPTDAPLVDDDPQHPDPLAPPTIEEGTAAAHAVAELLGGPRAPQVSPQVREEIERRRVAAAAAAAKQQGLVAKRVFRRTLIREALQRTGGSPFAAAKLVGCTTATIRKALLRWPSLREIERDADAGLALKAERNVAMLVDGLHKKLVDRAKGVKTDAIEAAEMRATTVVLRSLARDKWGQAVQVTGSGGGPIQVATLHLTPESIAAMPASMRSKLIDDDPDALDLVANAQLAQHAGHAQPATQEAEPVRDAETDEDDEPLDDVPDV